jgi:DNA-binding protein YbaB
MDLMGMMGKLKETQQKWKKTSGYSSRWWTKYRRFIKVTITNRTIKSVTIADDLLQDKEQLEDYMILVMNKAIVKASKVNEAELDAVAKWICQWCQEWTNCSNKKWKK